MIWMITLQEQFVKSFLTGDKYIELRTRVPLALRADDIVLVAQAGTNNKVVMRMSVLCIIKLAPDEMFKKYYKGIQLNYKAYDKYTKGRKWVYGIFTYNVERMEEELYTSDFGIKKAPQWFAEVYEGSQYVS